METLVAHMEWADRRVLAAAGPAGPAWEQPLAASYGSLAGTLEHLFATEWTWLERIRGRSPAQVGPPDGARTPEQFGALWPPVWAGWHAAVAGVDPAAVVRYQTSLGQPYETPLAWILLHVSHHSAAYRGQAAAVLRQLGLSPVNTDLIAFLRSRG
jgi:uncharacterized damage-inducible protein DinB